jgi:hypothetical protein
LVVDVRRALLQEVTHGAFEGLFAETEDAADLLGGGSVAHARRAWPRQGVEDVSCIRFELFVPMPAQR